MERLHVGHRLRLVLVEAEDLRGDEDVAAAGLHRVRQDELALPRRVEQVVPGRGHLATDLLREAIGVRDEAEDADVPTGPEARRVLELGLELSGVRRDVVLQEAGLAERVVELARPADEDVGLRAGLLGGDAGLQVARRRERQQVDRRARVGGLERGAELVVRGLVQRGVHGDAAGRLRDGRCSRARGGRRCRGRDRGRARPTTTRGERRGRGAEAHDLQNGAPVVALDLVQIDPSHTCA